MPYKLGRLPVIPDRPKLRLAEVLTGVIPPHPVEVDNIAGFNGGWKMLGNDQFGDCVAVTWANWRRLVTATLGGLEIYPTIEQVYALYRTQNPLFQPDPNDPVMDNGMNIQLTLEYLNKIGGPDGVKVVCFASVDHQNRDEIEAAEAIFGGLWTGITVSQANQQQFANGEPWDYDPSSPIEGGHSILSGGYFTDAAAEFSDVTWGRETKYSDAFDQHQVEEDWIPIFPEHLGTKGFQQGVSGDLLKQYYGDLTGRVMATAPSGCLPSALRRLRR
jgi:hypothetical protein